MQVVVNSTNARDPDELHRPRVEALNAAAQRTTLYLSQPLALQCAVLTDAAFAVGQVNEGDALDQARLTAYKDLRNQFRENIRQLCEALELASIGIAPNAAAEEAAIPPAADPAQINEPPK